MCAEKEPLDCHRTVLVSRRLAERGVPIEHLLADGTVQPHADIEEALLKKAGGGADLFEDREARLARAYAGARAGDEGKIGLSCRAVCLRPPDSGTAAWTISARPPTSCRSASPRPP